MNAGSSWSNGSVWVYARPGQQITVAVRVLMTVTSGLTQGWSLGVEHDPAYLTLQALTTNGTHTATVRAGGPPSMNETHSETAYHGFMQAVMIDTDQAFTLAPTANFIVARACYRIQVPYYYYGYLYPYLRVTNQIGDPKVRAIIVQGGRSTVPCVKNFTFNVYVSTSTSPTYGGCDLYGYWNMAGTGLTVVDKEPGGKNAILNGGGAGLDAPPVVPIRPFSCADGNGDGAVDLSDPIYVLSHLFQGGTAPCQVNDPSRVLKTGQAFSFGVSCGTDGHYKAGLDRGYVDNQNGTVTDLVTGLMWTKDFVDANENLAIDGGDGVREGQGKAVIDDVLNDLDNNPFDAPPLAGFSDWRMPTLRELMSIVDYSRGMDLGNPGAAPIPAADPSFFNFPSELRAPGCLECPSWRTWSSETVNGATRYVTFEVGHTGDEVNSSFCLRGVRPHHKAPHSAPAEVPFPPESPYFCGDGNGDGALDISDPVYTLNYLFLGGTEPCLVDRPVLPSRRIGQTDFALLAVNPAIVKDLKTGLWWPKAPSGDVHPWSNAVREAEGFRVSIIDDWRLPNAFELFSLVDLKSTGQNFFDPIFNMPPNPFPEPQPPWPVFWTSTTEAPQPSRAFAVDFQFSGLLHNSTHGNIKTQFFHSIIPVRGMYFGTHTGCPEEP